MSHQMMMSRKYFKLLTSLMMKGVKFLTSLSSQTQILTNCKGEILFCLSVCREEFDGSCVDSITLFFFYKKGVYKKLRVRIVLN